MKGRLYFFLFLLISFVSPILFYTHFDYATRLNKVTTSYFHFFAPASEGADVKTVEPAQDGPAKPKQEDRPDTPNPVVKCCSAPKDKEVVADSRRIRSDPQRRLNYQTQKEGEGAKDGSMDYHLDKTVNRAVMSEEEDEEEEEEEDELGEDGVELDEGEDDLEEDLEEEEEEEEEFEVAAAHDKLPANNLPTIAEDVAETAKQTAEGISMKAKKRKRGGGRRGKRGGKRRRKHRRNRRPRRRNTQEGNFPFPVEDVQETEIPVHGWLDTKRVADLLPEEGQVLEEKSEVKSRGVLEEKVKREDPKPNPSPPLEGFASIDVDENLEDVEVSEVLMQLGQAIKKTAVVMSNHAVQYPKDVCVVIVFVLLLIKLATWLGGGYRQQARTLVPLSNSLPLLSTSASGGTSFSETGLKPTLHSSFTCIPQTLESVRHLLPAESQPVMPCNMLKTGLAYQTSTSETCNLRSIPDTFTILKNMPADIDVADIYLDTFRRMAIQAGVRGLCNLTNRSLALGGFTLMFWDQKAVQLSTERTSQRCNETLKSARNFRFLRFPAQDCPKFKFFKFRQAQGQSKSKFNAPPPIVK